MAMLEVEGLATHFVTDEGLVRAVDGVSFEVERGEVLGLVGESGSGKTVASLSLLGLIPSPPGRIVAGQVRFEQRDGAEPVDLCRASARELRRIRGNRIAMVFQDPMTSLNPYVTIGRQLVEVLEVHRGCRGARARAQAVAMLESVGIAGAAERFDEHPHRLSGGQRQRVMMAMALLCEPELLIADEPTTALDVTVQAQILRLVQQRQQDLGLGVLWITHDLGVVARLADRVAVMYAGRIVEQGSASQVLSSPAHPYTLALQRSVLRLDLPRTEGALAALEGTPPALGAPIEGCPFVPRCARAVDLCRARAPDEQPVDARASHRVRCHRPGEGP